MRIDIPQLNKCCFCMPLRRGLLTWVYVKLVIALLMALILLEQVISHSYRRIPDVFYASMCIGLIAFIFEFIFDIMFIISAHKKNFVYLRIYYRYALVMLIIQTTAVVTLIAFELYLIFGQPYMIFIFHFMVELTFFCVGQTVLQIYFVVLVRSEVLKLENNTQFEFVNHTSEPECKAQIIA